MIISNSNGTETEQIPLREEEIEWQRTVIIVHRHFGPYERAFWEVLTWDWGVFLYGSIFFGEAPESPLFFVPPGFSFKDFFFPFPIVFVPIRHGFGEFLYWQTEEISQPASCTQQVWELELFYISKSCSSSKHIVSSPVELTSKVKSRKLAF